MRKETISNGQAISLVTLFLLGTSVTTGAARGAKNNGWIAVILAILEGLPFLLIYTGLLSQFPGKHLFDILKILLGKPLGKLVVLLYSLYALQLGSLVLKNFSIFVHSVALPETPDFVTYVIMGILVVWIVRAGIEVMARTAKLMLIIVVIVLLASNLPSLGLLDPEFIKPILGDGWPPVVEASFSGFAVPFSQIVILTGVVFSLEKRESIRKTYVKGYLIAGLIILILGLRNIMMLGEIYGSLQYFPSYTAISRIKVGRFVQRVEGAVDIVLLTSAFFKTGICLFATAKGLSAFFNHSNYRTIVLPAALLMVVLTDISFESVMDFEYFNNEIYPLYVLPLHVFIPILLFIVFLIRKRMGRLPAVKDDDEDTGES